MQLRVITPDGIKFLKELRVGDMVWCDSEQFLPVRSRAVTFDYSHFIRLSNAIVCDISTRTRLKTKDGFKYPSVYDEILITDNLIPLVVGIDKTPARRFLYDILIDGNMVSPEGVVFKFGD